MPMLAIFRPRVQTPVSPGLRSAVDPQRAERADQGGLELPQIPVQVLPVLPQIDDRVAHQLARGRGR